MAIHFQATTTLEADCGYTARGAFESFHARTERWACLVVHRRAGKTVASVMDLVDAAIRCKKPDGRFSYLAPTYAQAKDASWQYLKRFTADIRGIEQRESDLMVKFPNGARVRLYGSENYDRLRGVYNDGIVLDEVGDIDPRAWPEVLRPSLADRHGWAVFIGTPKGRNSFYDIHKTAESSPDWYSLVLRADQSGLLPQSELDDMRQQMSADQFDQELLCSFDAAIRGSIYRTELQEMETSGRICSVPYDPAVPVWTAWDLGIGDATAIFCAQVVGREVHIIDYHEDTGQSLPQYVDWLNSKPYRYGIDLLPHDAGARELGTGKTREELLRANGRKVRVLARQDVDDGINACKMLLSRCWFDRARTERARECLAHYHRDFNDRMGVFRDAPVHDWSSHCFTGDTKVLTRHGTHRIECLPATGEVLTPCGWMPYVSPRVTRRDARLVEVRFTDGLSVRCTPDHLFLTARGWKSAESLRTDTLIQSSLTRSPSISMAAFIAYGRARNTCRAAAASCIETFGRRPLVRCLRAVTSTIETTIRSTMPLPTLSACRGAIIYPQLGEMAAEASSHRRSISPTRHVPRPQNGIDPMLAGFGIAGTLSAPHRGQNGSVRPGIVRIAASLLTRLSERMRTRTSIAPRHARPLRIASVVSLTERSDVWCLTVPGAECFSLANGAVVHNCADALRTLAMGIQDAARLPQVPKPQVVTRDYPSRGQTSWMTM